MMSSGRLCLIIALRVILTNGIHEDAERVSDKCKSSYTVFGPEIWDGEISSPKDENNRQCQNSPSYVFEIRPAGLPGTAIRLHLEHVDLEGKDSKLHISLVYNQKTVVIETLSHEHSAISDIVAPELHGMELIFYSNNFAARFSRFNDHEGECSCPKVHYNVKDLEHNISSPNYPNPANCRNTNCYYVLQARDNNAVQVKLLDADLGEDTVTIREHLTLPREEIAVWSGNFDSILSKHVTSRSQGLIMRLSRMTSNQGRGFIAQTKSVDSTCVCPNSIFDLGPGESGTITSPTFPQMYCPNFNCTYYFSAVDGYAIQYEFNDFYIEDCTDKLSILDANRRYEWELIHFCDQIIPDKFFTTRTRQSAIKLVTGSKNINARFNISYKAIEYDERCGCSHGQPKVITAIAAHFQCAQVLECPFLDCIYELRAPSLAVQQISINLSVSTKHPHGVVYLYEGLPSGNMRLHDSYGQTPEHILILHSNVTIHYHSVWLRPIPIREIYSLFGFYLSFSWPECSCGETELYAEHNPQYLLSPNHPQSFCNGLHCIWRITAPEDRDVFVDVMETNLELGRDILSIFCGANITDMVPIEILTGNYTSRRIFSCHTVMALHFVGLYGTMINRSFKIQYKILSENDNIGRLMVAENFENLVDKEIDPCEDFYEYACGKFYGMYRTKLIHEKLTHKLTKDLVNSFEQLSVNNSSPNALQQIKKAYIICKTDRTPEPQLLKQAMAWLNKTTGGLPIIYQNETQDLDPYRLAGIFAAHGFPILINVGIMPMWNKPRDKIVYIDQGVPLIPLVYREVGNLTLIEETKKQIRNQLIQFASLVGQPDALNETMLESDLSSVFLIDEILADGGDKGATHRETFAEQYNLYSLDEVKTYWPHIGWDSLITGLVGEEIKGNLSDRPICIANPTYFDALNQLEGKLQDATILHLQNYLVCQLFKTYTKTVSASAAKTQNAVQVPSLNYEKQEDCVTLLNRMLEMAASRAYIDYIWSPTSNATAKIREIGTYIANSFHKIVDQTPWMTTESKQRAHNKLDEIKSTIAFPDWIMDDEILDKMHPIEQLDILDSDSSIDLLVKLWDRQAWMIGQLLLEENDWPLYSTTTAGAWHYYSENSLFISAPTIAAHMFNEKFPAAINFGAFGFFFAHEMGHALNALEFEESGLLQTWTDTKTMIEFQKLKECFISQYSNSCYPHYDNICVNGNHTLTENLADHVALVATYDAHKSYIIDHGEEERLLSEWGNMSMEQIYFVAMAHNWCEEDVNPLETILTDPHAPNKWRVINTLRNFPTFAKEFKCKIGAGMAPEHYCSAWDINAVVETSTKTRQVLNKCGKPTVKSYFCALLGILIAMIFIN